MSASRLCAYAASVLLIAFSPAVADELPIRKAGLWEMKMAASPPMPAVTMQQCTDATTDRQMSTAASPAANETCSKNEVVKTATGFRTDSTCTIAGRTSSTHSEITGDFGTAYTVKVTSQLGTGARETTATIDARWVGICKPDQKPGDVIMPGGFKINITDLAAARSKMK